MAIRPVNFPSRKWTTLQVRIKISAKTINANPDIISDTHSSAAESLGEIDPGNKIMPANTTDLEN